jgi:hypothetical protein
VLSTMAYSRPSAPHRSPALPQALVALALLAGSMPLFAQYDGALSLDWGAGDGFATWEWSGEVFLEAAVATNDLLYGVGDYDFPPGARSLHFQAVDRNGEVRSDRSCRDSTGAFGAFTEESGGEAAILDSSGNLLVGGWVTFTGTPSHLHALLARYEIGQAGCTLDEDFSTDGFRLFDTAAYCDPESCVVVALGEIRPETGAVTTPRIVALMRASVAIGSYDYYLIGLTGAGALDLEFGAPASGVRRITSAELGTPQSGATMAVDDAGRIVVLLTRLEDGTTSDLDTMALRYTADGAIDNSFGEHGLMTIQDSGVDDTTDTFAGDLLLLPDGSAAASVQRGSDWLLYRFDEEGVFSGSASPPETVAQFAYQGDDRFLTARESLSLDALRLRRYDLFPDGYNSDPTFGSETGGGETYDIDFGGGSGQTIADFLLWGGRPVLVGHAFASTGDASGFLMLTESTYIFADGFESGTRARWWGY